jgi:hypothetical protein
MDTTPKDFLAFDYSEVKDLSKAFLTLISGILVFSVTFSEKIVKFPGGKPLARRLLLMSWAFFILAILASGLALNCIFYGASKFAHGQSDYTSWGDFSYWSLDFGGFFFVVGLICLMASAVVTYVKT